MKNATPNYKFKKNSSPTLSYMQSFYRFIIVILLLQFGVTVNGQRTASVSGNWSSTATWGGSAVPTSADAVTINTGISVTMNVNSACSVITSMGAGSSIVGSGSNTLTLGATATIAVTSGASDTATISCIISGAATSLTNSGGTLVLSGANTYEGSTTVAGKLILKNAKSLGGLTNGTTVNSGIILYLDGGITYDAEPLTLAGGILRGTTAIGQPSTYTGPITTTGASTIQTGAGNDLTVSNTINNAGSTLLLSSPSSTTLTVSGVISGSGALSKGQAGTVILSGANTYSGLTNITAGILKLGVSGDATNSPLGTIGAGTSVSTGASLDLAGFTLGTAEALTINGTGNSSGGALMNSGVAATYSGLITLGSASIIAGGTGTITLSNAGTITGATFGLTLAGASGGTLSSILGITTGTLTKAGAGTWTLSGANTFTGATSINTGTLNIQNAAALGTTDAGTTVASGAALQIQGGITVGAETLSLAGTGISANGALRNISGANTYGGLITLTAATEITSDAGSLAISNPGTISGTAFGLTLDGSGDGSIASIIGTTTGTLTKAGAGTWTLSGANTFTGLTSINIGALNIQNAAALGTIDAGTTVASGAALQIQGGITVGAETLSLAGTGISANGALRNISGTNTYGGLITLTAETEITSDAGSLAISNAGTITGATFGLTIDGAGNGSIASILGTTSGTLTKAGAGIWTLSGTNTYTGLTTINAGSIIISNVASLGGTTAGTTVNSGANLSLIGTNITFNAEPLTLSSSLTNANTSVTWTGPITLAGNSSFVGGIGTNTFIVTSNIDLASYTLQIQGGGSTTTHNISGIISGTGSLTKSGSSTWTLSNANTYTGSTTISLGTLKIANGTNIPDNSAVSISPDVPNSATLDLAGNNETIGSLAGTVTGRVISSGLPGTYTLTTGGKNSSTEFLGRIIDTLSNSVALTKTGTGTLTLSGVNTYTGGTTIKAGVVTGASAAANAFGTGAITLGNSTGGSSDATALISTDGLTYSNAIALASTTTGTLTIGNTGTAVSTTFSGGVTGTNNLTINSNATTGTITLATGAVNNTGTITNTGTGTGTTTISAVIGTNVTGLTQNSGTSGLTLSGANTYTTGTTIKAGVVTGASAAANAFGTGAITLGNSTGGSSDATVLISTTGLTYSNAIALASTTTGTLTIGNTGTAVSTTFSGGVTGTNNLTINSNATTGTITLATGAVNNTGTITNIGVGTGTTTVSAVVGSNVTGLTQNSGTSGLTLSGLNTYTGATTVSAGTLKAGVATTGANGAFGNGSAITMANTSGAILDITGFNNTIGSITGGGTTGGNVTLGGATLTVGNTTSPAAYAGIISGTNGNITKVGTGTLTLSGTNTYTGATTVSAGILNIQNAQATGTAAGGVSVATGATLDMQGGITVGAETLSLSGTLGSVSSDNVWQGNITLVLAGTFSSRFLGATGTGSGLKITGAVALGGNTLTITGNSSSANNEITGIISGSAGNINKTNPAGAWTLSAQNTFTGGVVLNAGTLRINNAQALGTIAGTFNLNGGVPVETNTVVIDNTSGSPITTLNYPITLGTNMIFTGTNALNLGTGALTLSASRQVTVSASTLTVGGIISGSGFALTKDGAGTLTLSGANTHSGGTILSSGQLNINHATAIGSGAFTISGGTINNTSGSAITLSNNNTQNWNGDYAFTGTNALNLGIGAVTLSASRQVTVSASNLTVGGIISGSGFGLTKAGAGTMTLSGTNTFTGGTTLSAGTLNINNSQALGTSAGTFTIAGGTIDATTAGITTVNYPLALNADFTFAGTNSLNLGAGAVSFSASRIVTTTANTLTVGGAVSAAASSLTKAGIGTLSFGSNAVTVNGLTISAGTLSSTSGTLSVAGNFSNSATFTHNSGTVTFNGTTAQTINTGGLSFNNFTISNSSGASLSSNDATVTGTLTFTNGVITTGSNKVIIGSAGSAGTVSRTAGHVNGNLRRYVPNSAAPTVDYPVGDATNYTPVSVAFAGTVTGSGYLDASTAVGAPPVASSLSQSKYINRSWILTNTSLTGFTSYSPSFTWVDADKVGSPTASALVISKLSGTTWLLPTMGSTLTNSTQATGISSFSTFYIGETNCTATNMIWSGATSTDWFTAGNWCGNALPSGSVDVTIPTGLTNQPVINAAGAACRNITINSGSTLSFSTANSLSVAGNWVNEGTFTPNSGTVTFNGSTAQTINSGSSSFNNVSIANTSGGVSLASTATITGSLALTTGNLSIGANTLSLGSTVSGSGYLRGSSTSNLTVAGVIGTVSFDPLDSTAYGYGTYNRLKDLVVNTGASATLGTRLNIVAGAAPGSVTVNGTGTLSTGDQLVLKSDASGTARVAAGSASGGYISGQATVERYIPATGTRWRLLTIPVTGISIRDAWANGPVNTNAPDGVSTGVGTLLTGYSIGSASAAASKGWDWASSVSQTNGSIRFYTNTGSGSWLPGSNTPDVLATPAKEGYMLYVRGDRSVLGSVTPNATVLRPSGTLKLGDKTIPLTASSNFAVVGNPYASAIDFNQIRANTGNGSAIVTTYFYAWDASLSTFGGYRIGYYDGSEWKSVPGYVTSGGLTDANVQYIQSGTAFIVKREGAGTSLLIEENDKASGGNPVQYLGTDPAATNRQSLLVNLMYDDGNNNYSLADGVSALFGGEYLDSPTDRLDIYKINNDVDNMSLLRQSTFLGVEGRPVIKAKDTLFLAPYFLTARQYALQIKAENLNADGITATLLDGTTAVPLDITGTVAYYPFTSTGGNADLNRFKIVFTGAPTLPVSFTKASAWAEGAVNRVSWQTGTETNIKGYEMERSGDGRSFTGAAGLMAPLGQAFNTYSWTDGQPEPVSYYRIKAVANDGQIKYSGILSVNRNIPAAAALSVYPNPVRQHNMQLKLEGLKTGNYNLALFNAAGQQVFQKGISNAGTSAVQNIKLDSRLAAGLYHLNLTGAGGGVICSTTITLE